MPRLLRTLLMVSVLVWLASAASNHTTTVPVSTQPPPAPQSDGPDVRAIRFALLGTAIGLVGCGACVLLACWVHKNRTLPGTDREVPTADTLDEERALQKAKREQQAKDDQMRFGPGTKVRGQHLVDLKEHWDEKHRQAADRKRQDAHDNRPVNAYGEYVESVDAEGDDAEGGAHVAAAAARPYDASSAASPVNPIDRFRNADAVASYRTNPGPHAMPWEGESRVGADGMPIQVVQASDVDSPDRWPVGTEFSRQSNAVSAPANTQFTAPGATSPVQQPEDAPFVLKMTAAAKAAHEADAGSPRAEDHDDGDANDAAAKKRRGHRTAKRAKPPQGLLAHVRSFFINDPEIDSAVDARFVRPDPDEVFKGLARRDEALAGGRPKSGGGAGHHQQQQALQRSSRLQQQVDQHEMTETAYADATGVADLCAEWLEDLEPPKIDKRVAMRNVANWCGDLPPEPAGAEAQQGFARDRTGRWVEAQRPDPYALPPQSRSVYTPPAVTPPNATTPRTPGVRSAGHTPRRESGAGDPLEKPQAHIPMALRLTSDSLRLPPKRDSLGRLMAP